MKEKYDENSIDILLKSLDKNRPYKISDNFTMNVMDKIKEDNIKNIKYFDRLYLKFSIGASAIAAACLLLAINLFTTYTPSVAEFVAMDYFNISIF